MRVLVNDTKKIQAYLKVIPMWIRGTLIAAAMFAAIYWTIAHDFTILGDDRLGFLVIWVALLVPVVAVIYSAAWLIHRNRKKDDFPRAKVVQR